MIIRSKYLICSGGKVIENGAVALQDTRIEAVGRFNDVKRAASGKVTDLGDEILAPGFVNAHTHLELTALKGSIPKFYSFADWLWRLVSAAKDWTEDDYIDSALAGMGQSLEAGTTCLVETSRSDPAIAALKHSSARKFLLFEVLGFQEEEENGCRELLDTRLARCEENGLLRAGISPHSAYSVSTALLQYCAGKAVESDRTLSIHTAESPEEEEFVRNGTGPIADFKQKMDLPADDWTGAGCSPVAYLHGLGLLGRRTLLVHGNYLSDNDIETIAKSRATVVYCPRSHKCFGHPVHPLEKLLAAGVPVALGTDSLASNESLSILDEMKHVKARFPQIDNAQIFSMGTAVAMPALGLEGQIGVLEEGAEADIVSIMPGEGADDPLGMVLAEGSRVMLNMIGGRILYDSHASMKR